MRVAPAVEPLSWKCTPLAVAAAWPADRPLVMLHSARPHPRWARWSVLSSPRATFRFGRKTTWTGSPPAGFGLGQLELTHDPMVDLDTLMTATRLDREAPANPAVPFLGGWIGYFSYDLGRRLEPTAQHDASAVNDRPWPVVELAWCPGALVYDNLHRRWFAVGDIPEAASLRGDGDEGNTFKAAALRSNVEPDEYLAMVARTIDYIAAGDVFQANITHRLSASFAGSTRALACRALALSGAWYGAYLELPQGRCICSLSPELFLDVDFRTRAVVTRPIKGTRPSAAQRRELLDSAKDAAELHMIVDLMRNDLGRVCEYGSVHVPQARTIETHPTVHHGVAEVTGSLRPQIRLADLLRATFPGGSVTGAPKIRAMQIIDELEPVRRGPYCGAIGFISDCGRACLNIAIRTIALTGRRPRHAWDRLIGTLDYGTGGGIVADSNPLAEYRESLDKAEILRMVLRRRTARLSLATHESNVL
ncbi:MAG: anthranilate synthase component I family protein [Planctomycetes bacterium]|nr:anthranilate synthase component I family protein [Planctomycetota bacterium]